jgi:hypothetical protein
LTTRTAFVTIKDRVADADFVAALQHVNGLFLHVVNVQGRAALGRDLYDKIVEGPTRFLARNLENQIAAWPRLKPPPLALAQNDVRARHFRLW